MPLRTWTQIVETWLQTHLHEGFDLAYIGLAVGLLILLGVIGTVLRGVYEIYRQIKNAQIARKLRNDPAPGYRLLLARPVGRGSSRAARWLSAVLDDHLGKFNFGAPFTIAKISGIRGGAQPKALRLARARMQAADADMLIWATRLGSQRDGFVLHGLSRGGGLPVNEARLFSYILPGKFEALRGQVPELTAYFLAKQLQPALGNPQAFRPEKMLALSEMLEAILADSVDISAELRNEVEADYCASAVHAAAELGDLQALDRVIKLRRQHLESATSATPPTKIIQARMDMGRALLARAGAKFDPAVVDEAIRHLSKVIESLQTDPTIQRAQLASDTMFKAQSMLESRKRFSVNFGT